MDIQSVDAATNTNPLNQEAIINTERAPHNITVKNYNPNEPKISKPNKSYRDKHKYRKYKLKLKLNYIVELCLMMKKN
jgi:hypothetical protein